jgi:hypothetical protein
MVPGAPNAIPSFMSVQLLALRVLQDKLPQIADAMAPGGSGNPYAGLSAQQQSALREVTRLGFPLRGWWQYASLSGGAFDIVAPVVRGLDPTYVNDFWTKPGYAGDDPSVQAARVQYDTTVQSVVGNPPTQLVLSHLPTGTLTDSDLIVTSGAAAGKTIPLGVVTGNTASIGAKADPAVLSAIQSGDGVRVDNSWVIALEYYQRYQVPSPDEYGWNQYRNSKGAPIYPQRPMLTGPVLTKMTAGTIPDGRFHGKMIMLASTMDVQAYNWSADWYRKQALAAKGSLLNDSFRLWWMDNADHDPGGPKGSGYVLPTGATDPEAGDHVVSYTGELQEALLYLNAWVTHGTKPPTSTSYRMDQNQQATLPNSATRGGVQPIVSLSAQSGPTRSSSASRITVTAGKPVTFTMQATAPAGTGKIVRVEWDYQGAGAFTSNSRIAHIGPSVLVRGAHTFSAPGTYFSVVRVTSQRNGDPKSPFEQVENLASVRVVVH